MRKQLLATSITLLLFAANVAYSGEGCPDTYADCGGWQTDSSGAPIEVIQEYICNTCQGPVPGAGTACDPGPRVSPTLIVTVQKPDGTVLNFEYGECNDTVTDSCSS